MFKREKVWHEEKVFQSEKNYGYEVITGENDLNNLIYWVRMHIVRWNLFKIACHMYLFQVVFVLLFFGILFHWYLFICLFCFWIALLSLEHFQLRILIDREVHLRRLLDKYYLFQRNFHTVKAESGRSFIDHCS